MKQLNNVRLYMELLSPVHARRAPDRVLYKTDNPYTSDRIMNQA